MRRWRWCATTSTLCRRRSAGRCSSRIHRPTCCSKNRRCARRNSSAPSRGARTAASCSTSTTCSCRRPTTASRRSTIWPIIRSGSSVRSISPDMPNPDMPNRATTRASRCSSTATTVPSPTRSGACSRASSRERGRSRRSSNGTARSRNGRVLKRKPPPRKGFSIAPARSEGATMRPDPSAHERTTAAAAYAAAFSAALLEPDRETPALVSGPAGKAAAKRYNVYRNNVTVSLIDALAAVYPAVQRVTGVEFFRAMARFHIRETPPTSPLLLEYGRDFPAFIERYEYARGMPWLADAARIERAWLDAYHAADVRPLTASDLASVPAERLADLVFAPHPATWVLRSRFAAVTIVAANRAPGPVEAIDASQAEDALITRPESDVVVRRLAPGEAEFLSALIAGRPLGEAVGATLEAYPDFDIGAGVATLIESGACASASLGDNS